MSAKSWIDAPRRKRITVVPSPRGTTAPPRLGILLCSNSSLLVRLDFRALPPPRAPPLPNAPAVPPPTPRPRPPAGPLPGNPPAGAPPPRPGFAPPNPGRAPPAPAGLAPGLEVPVSGLAPGLGAPGLAEPGRAIPCEALNGLLPGLAIGRGIPIP